MQTACLSSWAQPVYKVANVLWFICARAVFSACSGTFLVASSRWNRAAGAGAALVRLSEVTDWEEGGRTGPQHAARIFQREVPDGERRVLVARRQVSAYLIAGKRCDQR